MPDLQQSLKMLLGEVWLSLRLCQQYQWDGQGEFYREVREFYTTQAIALRAVLEDFARASLSMVFYFY